MLVCLLRMGDTNVHPNCAENDYQENVGASLPGKVQDRTVLLYTETR